MTHLFARFVFADHPKDRHLGAEAPKVLHYVSGPTQHPFTADDIQNWNRGFRGNPLNVSPEILVEHQISDDYYPATTKRLQAAQEILHTLPL
jgi:hypothetical protein